MSTKKSQINATMPPAVHPRVVVLTTVYHQPTGEQPLALETRVSRFLETDEQPCLRKIKVGKEWQFLDTWWLKEASFLMIRNDEGLNDQVVPTEEEKALVASKIIEVTTNTDRDDQPAQLAQPDWLIHPGEPLVVHPTLAALKRIRLRCLAGEVKATILLIPK